MSQNDSRDAGRHSSRCNCVLGALAFLLVLGRSGVAMATVTEVVLFDMATYERVVVPLEDAARRGDSKCLVAALRRFEARAPDAVPMVDPDVLGRLLVEQRDAENSGNLERAREARWSVYEAVEETHGPQGVTRSQIVEALTYLEKGTINSHVRECIRGLTELLCIPWDRGVTPRVNIDTSGLTLHLQEESEVVGRALNGEVPGEALESSPWMWSYLLARDQAAKLRKELDKVPPPREDLQRRVLERLVKLLDFAVAHPDLRIAIIQSP
jgi:hypothetical protein